MSTSVHACWKRMTEDDSHNQPHFGDGGASWGNWVGEVFGRPDLLRLAKRLGISELLTHKTDGMYWFQIKWLAPRDVVQAAERMHLLIEDANNLLRRRGRFWEKESFDTLIRDAAHLGRAIRYTENNPVKAGLIRDPKQWPWSSARWRDEFNRLPWQRDCGGEKQ